MEKLDKKNLNFILFSKYINRCKYMKRMICLKMINIQTGRMKIKTVNT